MPTYQVKRTLKFLQAISHVRYILDEDWVRQSLLAGHFVDEARFMLRDAKAEKKFGFKLRDALRRRESGRVLDGYSVYSTVGVKPPKADMRGIVTSAGGKYLSAAPRTGGDSLLFVSCPDDLKKAAVKKLVKKLVREAWVVVWYARLSLRSHVVVVLSSVQGVVVYSKEVVLLSVLRQQLVSSGPGVILSQ